MYKKLVFFCVLLLLPIWSAGAQGNDTSAVEIDSNIDIYKATENGKTELIIFVREGCGVCRDEEEFLTSHSEIQKDFSIIKLDINDPANREMWGAVVEQHGLSKVTPITLVGGDVIVGFNESTTGKKILSKKYDHTQYGVAYYTEDTENVENPSGDAVCQVDSVSSCSLDDQGGLTEEESSIMMLPYFGEINVQEASLFMMSAILGFIDGFNPCAMWVLLTFLILLSQVGSKRKMIYLAGIFILAEAIMYFMILNVWYQTWDFIQLDRWVTPAVGLLAIGAGFYFLHKAYKSKGQLTCDVTSFEHQQKTTQKIKDTIAKPVTILTTLSVLGIAFSVNIIEFACSVGIAQSFTKILELNDLGLLMREWYIFIYSLFYMADDFLIFGLAIMGYQRFHVVGAKYSHLSTIIGGILMIILGVMLTFFSDLLVF